MASTQSGSRKGSKFLDVKLFIAALALAVTIGLWNLISTSSFLDTQKKSDPQTAPPPQASGQDGQGFGAIPTLVPLVEVDASAVSAVSSNSSPVSNNTASQPAAALRSVTAPEQTIVQKSKITVDQQAQVVVVGSSGGGGGGAVATTRSSK